MKYRKQLDVMYLFWINNGRAIYSNILIWIMISFIDRWQEIIYLYLDESLSYINLDVD